MKETEQLLKAYIDDGSEAAFCEIVARYSRLVYSTALRQVGDFHAAQDITQLVFTHLARQARVMSHKVMLGGWLYRDTVFTASKYRRSLARQRVREVEAARMNDQTIATEDSSWLRVAPLLEDAMTRLGRRDRDVIVLRYFEGQPFRSVGAALGINEDAARMRVERALEKLRRFLASRGVAISATGLAAMLANDALGEVSANMTASVAARALENATSPHTFYVRWPDWIASHPSLLFKLGFGLAGMVLIVFVAGLVWHAAVKAKSAGAAASPPPRENRSIQLGGTVKRTITRPPGIFAYAFKTTARPDEPVTITNVRDNYRLSVLFTFQGNNIRVQSSLLEDATNALARTISFPSILATNGERCAVSQGIYSFEFTPTFVPPAR